MSADACTEMRAVSSVVTLFICAVSSRPHSRTQISTFGVN